jgi:hypothetical protein
MTFALTAILAVLLYDFVCALIDRIENVPNGPDADLNLPPTEQTTTKEEKDFETILKEYEQETEQITWEVKNKS